MVFLLFYLFVILKHARTERLLFLETPTIMNLFVLNILTERNAIVVVFEE